MTPDELARILDLEGRLCAVLLDAKISPPEGLGALLLTLTETARALGLPRDALLEVVAQYYDRPERPRLHLVTK